MQNLFSAIELGKNSLLTQQQIFQIIGHNIANVNTDGYSRQVPVLESVAPEVTGVLSSGRGVSLAQIFASRSQFVDSQIVGRKQAASKYDTLNGILEQVEALFDESSSMGLSDNLTDFFQKWSDLANQPTDIPSRNSLVSSAQSLTENISNAYLRLTEQQQISDGSIANAIEEINSIAHEIAGLNEQISRSINMQSPANDLIDQRTQRIKELSNLIGINVYYDDVSSAATIEAAGRPLVNFTAVYELSVQRNPANNNYLDIYSQGSVAPINDDIRNGKIDALLQIRDTLLPDYKRQLDNLAYSLGSTVNAVHNGGYALDGVTTGLDFFNDFTPAMVNGPGNVTSIGTNLTFSQDITQRLHVGDLIQVGAQQRTIVSITDGTHAVTDAAFLPVAAAAAWQVQDNTDAAVNLQVAANIIANPNLVAAADAANAAGNNGTALDIAALMNGQQVSGMWSYHDYLHSLFVDLGNDTRASKFELDANNSTLNYLENKRDEISAVSLDEETANLMQFQKSYQAMAQFFSLVNGLADVLLQLGRA